LEWDTNSLGPGDPPTLAPFLLLLFLQLQLLLLN
jgi:hypothetical protein